MYEVMKDPNNTNMLIIESEILVSVLDTSVVNTIHIGRNVKAVYETPHTHTHTPTLTHTHTHAQLFATYT